MSGARLYSVEQNDSHPVTFGTPAHVNFPAPLHFPFEVPNYSVNKCHQSN
jgi:hypothetical protein